MDAATAVKKVLGSKSLVFRCGSATGCRARASSADCPGDFKHLSWHPTRNRWLAHVRGKLFQYHVDKGSALKEIRRATGASISQLRFQTVCGEIGNHAPHMVREKQKAFFKAMWHVYSHNRAQKRVTIVPGDLLAAIHHGKKYQAMFAAHPALLLLSVRGKEGAWKDALLHQWSQNRRQDMTSTDILHILRQSCKNMATKRQRLETEHFTDHISKNVTHHAGWLPMLQSVSYTHLTLPTNREV